MEFENPEFVNSELNIENWIEIDFSTFFGFQFLHLLSFRFKIEFGIWTFGIENLGYENSEFENLKFENSEFENLEFENSEFEMSELKNQEFVNSEFEYLDSANSELNIENCISTLFGFQFQICLVSKSKDQDIRTIPFESVGQV